MLTAANSYMLWAFAWVQFVTNVAASSYSGRDLTWYTMKAEPFGFTIPEIYLGFSIALVVFSLCAVVGGTWRTPRLWKRLLTVLIFASITLGFSLITLHLRHYCYERALSWRKHLHWMHRSSIVAYEHTKDASMLDSINWDRQALERHEEQIRRYEEKYHLPRSASNQPSF